MTDEAEGGTSLEGAQSEGSEGHEDPEGPEAAEGGEPATHATLRAGERETDGEIVERPQDGLQAVAGEVRRGRPPDGWQETFVAALAVMPNVRAACELAQVSRGTAYRLKASDAAFASAWGVAIEESCDRLEEFAMRRATIGEERVYETYRADGTLASRRTEQVVSDRLMELLLKAHRPDKYVDRLRVGDLPDTEGIDGEILGLARDLMEIKRGLGVEALAEGPAPPAGQVIETTEVERPTSEGSDV